MTEAATRTTARPNLARFLPATALVLGVIAFFAFGLGEYLTFEALREHRVVLMHFVVEHGRLAIALYIAVYALSTALSVPGATVLTVSGGLLFNQWLGTAYESDPISLDTELA